jgi:hypothetical protein
MERSGMPLGDQTSADDDLHRDDRNSEVVPPVPDKPDHRPEQPNAPGVVDAWFFLGW